MWGFLRSRETGEGLRVGGYPERVETNDKVSDERRLEVNEAKGRYQSI